jgi:hypothetical protein
MYQVGSVMQFLGGAILRVAVAGFIIGAFFVSFGVLPWEFAARLIGEPPAWLLSGWLRLGVL